MQLQSFDSHRKNNEKDSLSNQMSIEPDQVYGLHEINLDGADVRDCETHSLSKDMSSDLHKRSSKILIQRQGSSGSALNLMGQNANPQLKETIHIESTIRVNGEIENMTFGVELKGEPIRLAAKLHQKTVHAVVPIVRKDDDAQEDDQAELDQLMTTPFKSRIQSSLTFNDLVG